MRVARRKTEEGGGSGCSIEREVGLKGERKKGLGGRGVKMVEQEFWEGEWGGIS